MRPKRVTGLELQVGTGRMINSLRLELGFDWGFDWGFELTLESSFTPLLKNKW
jgi:hypothetical protein